MKKNEQLLREFGRISPTYIQEAQPGRVPEKHSAPMLYIKKRTLAAMVAAVVAISMMMFGFGFSVSAMTEDESGDSHGVPEGTLLLDIPEIITREDYDEMYARIEAGLAKATEIPEETREHWLLRFDAFWAWQDPSLLTKQHVIDALIACYPITEVVPVCTVDMFLTECERDFLYHMMTTYGGITQAELIGYYQHMYDLTESSGLSEEKKQTIYAWLPDVPDNPSTVLPADYLSEEAKAAGKMQMTPALLPYVLLPEDYERICNTVLAKYGVESVELLPMSAQKFLNNYTKYPLELSNPDMYHQLTEQHFAELTVDMELYALNPTLTMEQRVALCYQFATEADIWGDDAAQMAYSLGEDALKAVYGDDAGSWGPKRFIISTYWKNFMYVFGFANNEW